MTSEFDGADLNNDSYQIDTAFMDPNIATSAPADNDEVISALTSQSSPAAEDLASGHSKGGPKKDPAWTLVSVEKRAHTDGSTQYRVTCLNCKKEFGIWSGTVPPKIERVKAHTTPCYAAEKPKKMVDVSIKPHTVPVMTAKEKAAFLTSISEWWYRTGTPFYKAADPGFMATLTLLRPDCPKVTRKALASPPSTRRMLQQNPYRDGATDAYWWSFQYQ